MVGERIAKYAAAQWREMMTKGKVFDQLGATRGSCPQEQATEATGAVLVDALNAKVVTSEKLDALVDALAAKILEDQQDRLLSMYVDYDPDVAMAEAAKSVGLEHMQWPIKSSVRINTDYNTGKATHVSVSNGYGAEAVHHYPLDDGRWLVCRLSGSDVQKVIDLLHAGPSQEFTANPLGLDVR